jgi:hypothetical protein
VSRQTLTAAALTVALVLLEATSGHPANAPLGAFAVAGVAGALVLGVCARALEAWLHRPAPDEDSDGA